MNKSANSCAIIGGADGPTSVFLAGEKKRGLRGLRQKLRSRKYKKCRERVKRKIVANPHTLEETIQYIIDRYGATEKKEGSREYITRKKECRAGLVQQLRPDLLGEYQECVRPDIKDEQSVKEFIEHARKRQEIAENVSEDEFPLDYHLFCIKLEGLGEIELEIEKYHDLFAVSASSTDRKKMKEVQKRVQDIYRYYGVSEKDIAEQTERYRHLVAVLADMG